MTIAEYNELPDEEKVGHQSHRKCKCGEHLVRVIGHSIGDLHTVCPKCDFCPDCDDGAV